MYCSLMQTCICMYAYKYVTKEQTALNCVRQIGGRTIIETLLKKF